MHLLTTTRRGRTPDCRAAGAARRCQPQAVSLQEIGGLSAISWDGDLRTLPFMMGGMVFAARLVKA
ncbi:MAG: hypothetical protein R3C40_07380 [Parvularculaceae bacterium]